MNHSRTGRAVITLASVLALTACTSSNRAALPSSIRWKPWSDAVFERAKRENRFVLLDLEAVWCHWCHVMDETTYHDPAVVALIESRYIAVRVDQDSRPDISNRYEDYGWPATVVFGPDGGEIIKRSGYIPPPQMASVLQAIIDDPTPGPSVVAEPAIHAASDALLAPALRQELLGSHVATYDSEHGGWGFTHKYLDADSVEYSLVRARAGDAAAEARARQTLTAQLALIDPVWGGVYQYSTGGDWKEPHFEKIMSMQAGNLEVYSLAYALWHDATHLSAARDVQRFLRGFLTSPDGAFYTSQDADVVQGEHAGEFFALGDAERRKRGIPRIDTHVYARENGWAIRAHVALFEATADAGALDSARRAAQWIVANRSLPGGGFRHDAHDAAGPYLGDTLAMGRAFLALHEATAERDWLARAEQAADFIAAHFQTDAGFATAALPDAASPGSPAPKPQRDENVAVARFAN
ncbi:MAG: thioredoxin domain-containing protein, partial [Planctomycetes bacterium]|nr:thioredoxin domain-containing protein [Planctomycetota bacterium]